MAPRRTHLPGNVDIWVFVLGDMVFFGFYFLVFMMSRNEHPGDFLASERHLSLVAGVVNTLVLLASSRSVALAVQAMRDGASERARRLFLSACGCGVVFLAVKGIEWGRLASAGYTFSHNDFFMFYYALTGVHVLHVLIGMGLLTIASRSKRPAVGEAAATFWHMVDVLWVVLFALLYLLR